MAADTAVTDSHVHSRATVRPDKAATVAELAEAFRSSAATVLTEYRGLTVKQVTALRVALGDDTTYSVVKNTLTKLAAADAGLHDLQALLSGPTAVAFVQGDPVEAAKSLRDFARANPALVVKGGVLDGKSLSAAEIAKLADLESREVLLARMAGAMQASLSQAVRLFAAPLAKAAQLAEALRVKAEEDPSVIGGAGEAPAVAEDVPAQTAAADSTDAPVDEVVTPEAAESAPEADTAAEAPQDSTTE
jgi:large subunit ribosomal protein L10